MSSSNNNLRFSIIAVMILLAAFSRVLPHMPNFSPLGAIGLFGAAYFKKRWQAFLIPISATWLSDLYINNVIYAKDYPTFTWFEGGVLWIYGSYLLIALAGIFMLNKVTAPTVIGGALTSSAIFFIVTNFACWPGSTEYMQNFSGLLTCYAAGIPFLKGTLIGDLWFAGVLFGSFALMERTIPALKMAENI